MTFRPLSLSSGHTRDRASHKQIPGFTLVEMLVVITIIAVLIAVTAPGFVGILSASRLTQAGEQIVGHLSEVQQRAMSTGRPIEVRFYRMPEESMPPGQAAAIPFTAMVDLEYFQPGQNDPRADLQTGLPPLTSPLALARAGIKRLPTAMCISDNDLLSTLVGGLPTLTGNGTVPAYIRGSSTYELFSIGSGSDEYRSIIFYPEGTSLDNTRRWFLTVVESTLASADPGELKNFYTIQLDPVTGRISIYRP